MKAISLWQPWATLWVRGAKVCETRHWYTHVRGVILVHAAKKIVTDLDDHHFDQVLGVGWEMALPRGALLGTVHLCDCFRTDDVEDWENEGLWTDQEEAFGDWSPGRWAWQARDPKPFRKPIPWKGERGWFDVKLTSFAPGTEHEIVEAARRERQGRLL